jgi:hypothetical protein
MDRRAWAARNVAARLLAGPWTSQSIASGIESVLGPVHRRTRQAMVGRLIALADGTYPPSLDALTAHLLQSSFFKPRLDRPIAAVLDEPCFAPSPHFADLPIPRLTTSTALAEWTGQTPQRLDWLAGMRGGHGRADSPPLQHYSYAFIRKRSGTMRLLEAPKPRLKAIQRRILREILSAIPTHSCAHGFVPGRSCVTGAQVHGGEEVVATFDLCQFFPSISLPRVLGIFRSVGYPWAVSRRLAGLCTTATPPGVFLSLPATERPDAAFRSLCRVPHLAQGAPTSPALANLLAWKLDYRLHRLADALEANYTRYADDLAFSGSPQFARGLGRFKAALETIAGRLLSQHVEDPDHDGGPTPARHRRRRQSAL